MIHILRGLPGSGKSTWATQYPKAAIISADTYHLIGGVYRYDPTRVGFAHSGCLREFIEVAQRGYGYHHGIIVDNTNTTLIELAPYVRVCEAFGCPYEIVYFPCTIETAIGRNIHGVPPNTILSMNRNLLTEIVPAHWKQTVHIPTHG